MVFDIDKSPIGDQQLKVINRALDSPIFQSVLGKNLTLNLFKCIFVGYLIMDAFYYYLKWQAIPFDTSEGIWFCVNIFTLGFVYLWYTLSVKYRDHPEIGLKVAGSEEIGLNIVVNKRWLTARFFNFGFVSNIYIFGFIVYWPIWGYSVVVEKGIAFFTVAMIQDVYEIMVFFPMIMFLNWDNPRKSVYSKAKEKIKDLADNLQPAPSPVPLPVKV